MAAPINKILDDALLGFEDDDEDAATQQAPPAQPKGLGLGGSMLPPSAKRQGAGAAAPAAPAPASLDEGEWQTAHDRSSGEASTSASAGLSAAGPSSHGRGRAGSGRRGGRLPFDPLAKRNPRAHAQQREAEHLAEDLKKLVAEWAEEFTSLQPPHEDDAGSSSSSGMGTADAPGVSHASSVLAALQERTQKMVAEQARLNPTPPASAPAAAAAGGLPFGGLPGLGAASDGSEPLQEGHMSMIVDVVMQHLLSKEVLYQPMQEIRDKYPPWLEANRGQIDAAEFERYEKQYKCIVALCSAYETEPNNFPKLMELLQEMQACGEPPEAIVEEMSSAIASEQPEDGQDAEQGNGGSRTGGNSGVMGGLRGLFGGLRGFMGGSDGAGSSGNGPAAGTGMPPDLPLPQELLNEMPQELLDELQLPKELENCHMQ